MNGAAAWAGSIAAMVIAAGGTGGLLLHVGRREGKIDQILQQLCDWQRGHDEEHRAAGLSGRDACRPARRGPRG